MEDKVEYVVQTYTGKQYGWEDVGAYATAAEATQGLREYRENQPEYRHRVVKRKEKE